jgi:hypothetical protein
MRKLSRRTLAPVAALTTLGLAGTAFAVGPVKGATYSAVIAKVERFNGKLYHSTKPFSFKVSADGKKAGPFTFRMGYPVYCQGGGFGTVHSKTVQISNKGAFTAKLPIIFSINGKNNHQGFVIVKGKFAKHGKASGTVFTDFNGGGSCNGTSKFTASAAKH